MSMTPTTPRKTMNAPITVTPPSAANALAAQTPASPAGEKKPIVTIVAIVALIVAGVGGFILWKTLNPGPPLATAPTPKLTEFVVSEKFKTTPYEKQKELMGALDNREDEIEKLYRSGKLTEVQMSMAREAAWLGKNVGRMEEFYSSPPGQQRLDYVKKVVDKIDDVGEPPKTKGPPEEKLPKRDKKWGKTVIATFPPDVQAQWKEFQKAVDDEQDRRKKERKAAEKAAAATRPAATNATKSGPG
jgi:hypothetical protein